MTPERKKQIDSMAATMLTLSDLPFMGYAYNTPGAGIVVILVNTRRSKVVVRGHWVACITPCIEAGNITTREHAIREFVYWATSAQLIELLQYEWGVTL